MVGTGWGPPPLIKLFLCEKEVATVLQYRGLRTYLEVSVGEPGELPV
jgi:hypothetical protein